MVDTTAVGYTPVDKTGDTMTGDLTLSGAPTTDLMAATKKYVDDNISAGDASKALDNLASVAINESLIADTTNTYDLGSAGILWKDIFATRALLTTIELGNAADTTLSRASAGDINVEGNIVYRAGGTDVPVTDGGTGRSSATAYGVLIGGTTATGAHQSVAVGTATHVLTSNGAGAAPTFQPAAGGGGGAPVGATYIVQTADGTLTNEQVLASLATGIVKNTTATGVLSIAAEGTDYYGPGGTDIPVTDGGTGSSTAGGARTNLGLVIGTDVQAQDAGLDDIAALSVANGNFIVGDGANWVAESGATARTSLGLGSLAEQSTVNNDDWSGTDLAIVNGGTGASTNTAAANAIVSGASLTTATVASADKVLVQDADDSDNLKTVTAQSIADLAGGGGGGKVLQVVSTTLTTTFTGTSTTMANITGLAATITPANVANDILVIYTVNHVVSGANRGAIQILRTATPVGVGTGVGSRIACNSSTLRTSDSASVLSSSNQFVDSPATTSATTYQMQYDLQGGTFYLNRSTTDSNSSIYQRTSSTITLIEIDGT